MEIIHAQKQTSGEEVHVSSLYSVQHGLLRQLLAARSQSAPCLSHRYVEALPARKLEIGFHDLSQLSQQLEVLGLASFLS